MSDVSQGPGWWQASDGKWYSPEQAQGYQAPPAPAAPTGGYQSAAPAGGYQGGEQTGAYQGGQQTGGPGPGGLADWGTRVVATLIDSGIMIAVLIAGLIVAAILGAISTALGILVWLVVYLAFIGASFYFTYMTGAVGQSPGKKVMGIKVVSEETGQPIGGGLGIVRGLAHFLEFFIGYLFPLWDEKRQTFADKIMKTIVLANQPKQKFSPDLLKVK